MRRFLERNFPSRSLEADATELMRAAGPTPDAPEIKQRVRERLMQMRVRARPRFLLAPAAAALGVLAIGTAAGAALGVRWWRASHEAPRPAPVAAPRAPVQVPAPRSAAIAVPEPPAADETMRQVASPAPERTAAHGKRARSAGEDAETALLFEATRALRRDRDPVRAGALLDEYARRYPRGALAEEALAVAIEAAVARGDARAPALARRYLARYPEGHFRNAAARALGGTAE